MDPPPQPWPNKFSYLVGIGVTHSIAPPMHNHIFRALGHSDWHFQARECATVEEAMALFRAPTFSGGAVVTMPYKRTIMAHLDGLDEPAVTLGACNNVYRTADGALRGTNTDWRGVLGCLEGASASGRRKPAAIIGAGGAARAAVYALHAELKCSTIYIVNRDAGEVRELADECYRVYGGRLELVHVTQVEQVAALPERPFYVVGTVPDAEPTTSEEVEVHAIVEAFLASAPASASTSIETNGKGVLLDMCFKPRRTRFLKAAERHGWTTKLTQIAAAGFRGVELFYEDLEYLAREQSQAAVTESTLLAAARATKTLCDTLHLQIISLQPFLFYEGLVDRAAHAQRITKLRTWFKLAHTLGTDLIQIPSNFQPTGTTGDLDVIVADMREIAELGLQETPVVRFAYENLAWATHVSSWETLWEVVRRVDRPNLGCCLDTFNIAGRVWADPMAVSGQVAGDADGVLAESLGRLVRTVDVRKVFYVQVVDAERLAQPLVAGHPFYVEGQPARMSWSRNARLFLFEQEMGGYLPVVEVARAFLKELKFEGWVSMELFSRSLTEADPAVPREHARRGMRAWELLVEELAL
ncbi:3-dehydroshikimate dehydratase [Aspergillus brunneoviolaceus CBS 621.78]|uniref:3-dehydroshikimate dehydratase n=1 Tax=Aspergillus brunneoviolaceus CBS 621.78 TaxID=1450534 RepID=A0ACD1GQR3_9EURO|nr:3-dehydroshikimate dehydratase [Aspergillus brunneoviolaceus CBS 621.78]RAH51520.1 3-dehydroshikimate dehydratase [Aspergillus brunneoviolaceus CBS 621.78]